MLRETFSNARKMPTYHKYTITGNTMKHEQKQFYGFLPKPIDFKYYGTIGLTEEYNRGISEDFDNVYFLGHNPDFEFDEGFCDISKHDFPINSFQNSSDIVVIKQKGNLSDYQFSYEIPDNCFLIVHFDTNTTKISIPNINNINGFISNVKISGVNMEKFTAFEGTTGYIKNDTSVDDHRKFHGIIGEFWN